MRNFTVVALRLLALPAFALALTACPEGVGPNPPPPTPGEGEGEGEGEVLPDELDPDASTLRTDPLGPLPADGIAAYTIIAQLKDGAGRPMPDLVVTFASDVGVIAAPATATSDALGEARATLSSTAVGSATISASVATEDGDVALNEIVVEFDGCRTPEQAFEQELYPKVFSRCQGCHNDLGLAPKYGAQYVLLFPGVDDWAQRNVDVIRSLASVIEETSEGPLPRIVAKPSMLNDLEGHEGGLVIAPGTEEERLLRAFADSLNNPNACAGVDDRADAALSRVTLLSPRETFARAKIALTGDVATPEELAAMDDTEEALDAALDELMTGAKFEQRIVDFYADWFLTDRFTKQMGGRRVINRNAQYTRRNFFAAEGAGNQQCQPADDCCREFFDDAYCDGAEDALIETLAREPLEIIKRIVRQDRPISDAITLDHTFLTPLSATFYGFTDAEKSALFDANPDNDRTETVAGELHKTALNTLGGGPGSFTYPHAGLITTHATLARWPTTTSNKNRGRAQSIVMRRLMNIDVMKFAEFSTAELPPDADLDAATSTEVACTVCHSAVDPLAELFQNFTNNGQYRVNAPATNRNDWDAAFADELLPEGDDAMLFLSSRVVQHERFPLAMMIPVLTGLTGFEELDNSIDIEDALIDEKALAVEIQHKVLSTLRSRFANEHGLRVRPLIKDIVKNEIFRAAGVDSSSLTPLESAALARAGIGRGVMLTPEQLERKLASIVGFQWRANRSPTGTRLLDNVQQYRILSGGMNYEAISKRFREPSPVLARIVERMGNEVACIAVPQDFATTDRNARRLFKNVEIGDVDENLVRTELIRLHKLLLEEDVVAGDTELEASVDVFFDVKAAYEASGAAPGLGNDCRAIQSFEATPVAYPTTGKVRVDSDPDFTIRAWMATVSYLLADPRFFME